MLNASKQIQRGQIFREKETGRDVVVTDFGISQGDETTIQVTDIGEGRRWSGEFSVPIFRDKFTGPLSAQVE